MSALAAIALILVSIIGTVCGLIAFILVILLSVVGYMAMFVIDQFR